MNLIKVIRSLTILVIGVITLALVVAVLVYPPEYVYRVMVVSNTRR